MTTARDIIRKALQKNGVLVKGEPPSADEAQDALDALNGMIASWSNDSAIIYARTWESFPLVAAQSSYTIGTAANFNTERPLQVVSAYVRDGISDFDLDIVDDEGYNSFTYKSANGLPQYLNYDNAFPTARIRVFPVPMIAYTLFILTEKQISSFATLDTVFSLPPGWERALVYNLAVELAPEYGQRTDELTRDIARASLGMIKTAAIRARGMDTPRPMNIGNIYNGYWA